MVDKLENAWTEFSPDLKRQPESTEDSPEVMKYREKAIQFINKYYLRFLKSMDSVEWYHTKWKEIDKFDRGEQWDHKSIPPWVPKPVTNYIRYTRQQKRANLSAVIARPQFTPIHDLDVETVNMLQLAHDHVWDTHRVDRHIRRCIDRSLNQGTSILYVYHDDSFVGGKYFGEPDPYDPHNQGKVKYKNQLFQGDIKFKRWPVENFFPDPDAYNIEQCKWIDTTEIVALRDIKNNKAFIDYCTKNGTLNDLLNLNYTQLDYEDDASGTIFDRPYTPLNTPKNIHGDEIVTMHTHWERYYKKGKWHLDVTYWLRNTNFLLLRLEDVEPAEYPFAVYYDEEEENSFWGFATNWTILELQKLDNKVAQVAAIIGALHQNPQKVVTRESGINAQELARTGTLPGKVWSSNTPAKDSISILDPQQIPPALFSLRESVQQDIAKVTGINEAYTGQSVGSLTTSTGVDQLISRATLMDRDKMTQIDSFVERVSDLIVKFILYKWKDKRPIARVGENGQMDFSTYQPPDKLTVENITWRVRSDVYQHSPLTQERRMQQADKMMQWQGQYNFQPSLQTPEEWVKAQDLQNQQQILDRMQRERQELQQQRSQNLAQQISQVAQQIIAMQKQGASAQEIQQTALQIAQELTQQTEVQDNKNGLPTQKPPAQGVAGQQAMQAMNAG